MKKNPITNVRLKCEEPYAEKLVKCKHVFHLLKKAIKTIISSGKTTAIDPYFPDLASLQKQHFAHEINNIASFDKLTDLQDVIILRGHDPNITYCWLSKT